MDLSIVLRGQSNAFLFNSQSGLAIVQQQVQKLLGFDGVTNKVDISAYTQPGTALIPDPTFAATIPSWLSGSPQTGYTDGPLETGFLNQLAALPAAVKAAPTVFLYMQNEGDSSNPTLTTQQWEQGVEIEAAQARAVLGQSPATTPYLFANVPFSWGTDSQNQAIKDGVQQLSQNPAFNAGVAANFGDSDMNWEGGVDNGPHMGANDIFQAALRIANTVADSFAPYALPGSPLSTGMVDWSGPQGVQASAGGAAGQVIVTVQPGTLSAGLVPLGSTAASGEGFVLSTPGGPVNATGTTEVDSTHLAVTFGNTAINGSDTIYYDYGDGRLSDSSGNGYGTAIYDDKGLPLALPATGLAVNSSTVSPELLAQAVAPGKMSALQSLTDARGILLTIFGDPTASYGPEISSVSQARSRKPCSAACRWASLQTRCWVCPRPSPCTEARTTSTS